MSSHPTDSQKLGTRTDLRAVITRASLWLTIATITALVISQVRWAVVDWNLNDVDVYWDAALLMRSGESPYAASSPIDPMDPTATYRYYRYSPWFAAAWTPLTYLPRQLVELVWSGALLSSSLWIARQAARHGLTGLLCGGLLASLLVGISSGGNVQPLLVAALLFGLDRRSGPVWIALTASLKIVPILFVLVYAARREWGRVAVTLALSTLLVAPTFAFALPAEVFEAGPASLMPVPMFIAVAMLATLGAVVVAVKRPTYGPLAVSAAAVLALPRLLTYEVTLVAVGLAGITSERPRRGVAANIIAAGAADAHKPPPRLNRRSAATGRRRCHCRWSWALASQRLPP